MRKRSCLESDRQNVMPRSTEEGNAMSKAEGRKQAGISDGEAAKEHKDCTVYRVADNNGDAAVTSYRLFPGVHVAYNQVHRQEMTMAPPCPGGVLVIDHCREGRMEWEAGGGYACLSPGDLSIRKAGGTCYGVSFPLSHYQGITVALDTGCASRCLGCILEHVPVNAADLADRYCADCECAVIRARPEIEHIFSELYSVPDHIREGYLKIKVMELLLFLGGADISAHTVPASRSFSLSQVEAVRAARDYLTQHTETHITVCALAEHCGISQTILKACFKSMFGESVYSFTRRYKMQRAALLLRQTDKNVMEIAGMLGYDNASKFAGAFRAVCGHSPREYRRVSD